jgi:hypothetical protein
MSRGARLEYEDAQVRVCRRKTACDDATSSAAYGTSSLSVCGSRGEEEDGAPPAMMISYSSLIWVGVDIVPNLMRWGNNRLFKKGWGHLAP